MIWRERLTNFREELHDNSPITYYINENFMLSPAGEYWETKSYVNFNHTNLALVAQSESYTYLLKDSQCPIFGNRIELIEVENKML